MTGEEARRRQRASKDFERRVNRALGSDRWINDGSAHSDSQPDCRFSVECTQTLHPQKALNEKWAQCIINAHAEQRPPIVVAGEPGGRLRDAHVHCLFGLILDYETEIVELKRQLGLLGAR